MSVVHRSEGTLGPASDQLKSEVAIVCALAQATLKGSRVPWSSFAEDYDRIREAIEQVIPGFDRYNRRIREPGGFVLPNPARDRRFETATKRAEFRVIPVRPLTLEPGQLLLTTLRSHDQFNTTVYGDDDRYRGIFGYRRVILMHREDLAERGLRAGQRVDVTSYFAGQERTLRAFVTVPYDVPKGCAASYFPEANALVPVDSVAEKSRTPTSKAVVIRVTPSSVVS